MGVQWTKEQQKVIDLRDRNILVSAAAGSGKTAVLVERIISMLTDPEHPMDVDRLLVVTFTEAAAAEMKERIRTAIEKKLAENPRQEHLKRQATLIHSAQITTIHSFCLSVVRDHFHAIDLDPGFRIGEEGELKLLEREVLGEILEEQYEEGEKGFLNFASAYGTGRSDKKLEDLILKIFQFSRSYPDSEKWLEDCVSAYQAESLEELEESRYIRLLIELVKKNLQDAEAFLDRGIRICREPDGPAVYEEMMLDDRETVRGLLKKESYQALGKGFGNLSWMRLKACRDQEVSEEKILQVKGIREEVKDMVKDLASQYFYEEAEVILADLKLCRPYMEELARLTKLFAVRFEEKKRSRNLIDFSDMEQYALRILTREEHGRRVPSDIAEEYQRQFYEIMIDEYQDSNLIQETILTSISGVSKGRYNIFMVGDVKQSIYRFRLSRPELFMEKFDTYDLEDGPRQRIDLHKNFRSRGQVLDSVNALFRKLMRRELGGIAYDDRAALYVGASYPEGEGFDTEVLLVDTEPPEGEGASGGSDVPESAGPSALELEARAIAGRIRGLLAEQKVLDRESGNLRPARYGDIVVLTRSIRGSAEVFAEVLAKEGIPAHVGTREGYFSAQEVGLVLDYLRVLDNRRQDIPLAAVLASPMGELNSEELARIRGAYPEEPFHQAVERCRREEEMEEISRKLEKCLGTMDRLRSLVPYTPMHELLQKVLKETGYGAYAAAMPGGIQKKANLEMLEEKARAFEATSYKGLFHFIRYIEQLEKYDVDYGEASIEDENSDAVRIMTIHKSKGLEFPIVFAAGMGKRFNMQDARSSVVLHPDLGIGLEAIDLDSRTKSPSLIKKVIQKEEVMDSLAEELRVLYVAFTRAKEKLIITGTLAQAAQKAEAAKSIILDKEEALPFGKLSRASVYWDWLLPALVSLPEEAGVKLRLLGLEEITKEEVLRETTDTVKRQILEHWDIDRVYDREVKERLDQQFRYQYPDTKAGERKLKFTVSELKKRAHLIEEQGSGEDDLGQLVYEEPEVIPLIPKFLEEKEELTGASRGTAYHRVMELLDFGKDYSREELEEEIRCFHEEGKLSEEMASCIRADDIGKVVDSPLGQRLKEAAGKNRLWKEQPFVLGLPARELYPEEREEEVVLVQGIIDVYFEEEDGLVVLDYKTDRVKNVEELAEKYHAQLEYYAKALEQLTEKKVKEKIVYSFTLGEYKYL